MLVRIISTAIAASMLAAAGLAQPPGAQSPPGYRIIGAGITGASQLQPDAGAGSTLTLESSDARLVQAFDWAKRQARAYARDEDPVGPWYEGGEPGRESFCMRDISHQVMGGHALGLARHNFNMLHRFAENISQSKDWCSYWGMTRMNLPRRVDYRDNARFWYCLPANFDVLAACYRMFLWSGDLAYVNDPVFQNFYDRTVVDYVERWDLDLDRIMKRPRLMNVHGEFDPQDKFQRNRGIPGYDEQTPGYVLGSDVVATQYAAYLAYAYFQEFRGNEELARSFQKKAAAVRALVNSAFYNEKEQYFYARVSGDHKLDGRGGGVLLVHDVVDDGPRLKAALEGGGAGRASAEVLYKYGDPDAAYARMMDVAFSPGSRREYPETSFSWVGAFVNGTMGITLEAPSPLDAWRQGYWVDKVVRTLPGLGTKIAWAELRNVPIRANEVLVRHERVRKTTVINQRGPAFIWQATFPGSHEALLVNGQPVKALIEKAALGRTMSSVRVTLGAGGGVTVEVPAASR
ncbi:MAG: hypothetical protein ABSH44_15240 [Bryobacteraceae bacterium]